MTGAKEQKHLQIIAKQLEQMDLDPLLADMLIEFILNGHKSTIPGSESKGDRLLEIARANNYFVAQNIDGRLRSLFFWYVLDDPAAVERTDRLGEFVEIADFFKKQKVTNNFHKDFTKFVSRGNNTTLGRKQRLVLLKSYWCNLVDARVSYVDERGNKHYGVVLYIEPMPAKEVDKYIQKGVRVEPFWANVSWNNGTSSTLPISFLRMEETN